MSKSYKGFTLIEVIFAILILGGSLIIILGMQTSATSRALQDRFQLQAMLIARNVLAGVEIQKTFDNLQNLKGSALEILNQLRAIPSDQEEEWLKPFQVTVAVEDWEMPEEISSSLGQAAAPNTDLKKIQVVVSWGDTINDELKIVYFDSK